MYHGFNMGPRGRMSGHRGFRPEIFLGIIGLFCLGWIIIAVIGGVFGAGLMVLGAVFRSLAHLLPHLISRIFSMKSFAIGVVIGLIWYFRNHRRNTVNTPREESIRDSSIDDKAVETEIIEPQNYHTFHA